MVTKDSATKLSRDLDDQHPINGNHSTMVKFRHKTQGTYKNVAKLLKEAVQSKTVEDLPGCATFLIPRTKS